MDEARKHLDEWLRHFSESSMQDSRETTKAFHQTMTALAGGAIALSVGFVQKFVPAGSKPHCISFLFASWILFVVSLLSILVAFLLMLDNYYRMGRAVGGAVAEAVFNPEISAQEALSEFAAFTFSKVPTYLSWVSIGSFVVGVVGLLWFAALNFS